MALELQRTAEVGEIELPGLSKGGLSPVEQGAILPPLRVLGQVAAAYIVAEGPDGLYLIDQHSAHERVLFAQLQSKETKVASQAMLEPLILDLTPGEEAMMEEAASKLAELGFQMEPFGARSCCIRAVPVVLVGHDVKEVVQGVLDEVSGSWFHDDWRERAMAIIACHSAFRAGQPLAVSEMEALVDQLRETGMHTCPHGRPCVILLSISQLEGVFLRGKKDA